MHHEWIYIKHISDHPVDIFSTLDRALARSLNTVIFGAKHVQEQLLRNNSIPLKMASLGILKSIQEAPINHATSGDITDHTVAAILVEGSYGPNTHATTMTLGQTPDKAYKGEAYSIQYVDYMSVFIEYRQHTTEREIQVGQWINILHHAWSYTVLGS